MSDRSLIYSLLPELYRQSDTLGAYALEALTAVLDSARTLVKADIDALYRDWFVETCDEAVLPHLAALVGMAALPEDVHDRRALVADIVRFEREKGTVRAAERRLHQLGGWPVSVTPSAEDDAVAISIWQQVVDTIRGVQPRPIDGPAGTTGACFTFHPLGVDRQLFAPPRSPVRPAAALTRSMAREAIDAAITIDIVDDAGQRHRVGTADIEIADLSDTSHCAEGERGTAILIDPELGRLHLPVDTVRADRIAVTFTIASPGPIGGGGYARTVQAPPPPQAWLAYVHRHARHATIEDGAPPIFGTVAAALLAFASEARSGIIRILDSATYDIDGTGIDDRQAVCPPDPGVARTLVVEAIDGESPTLTGTLTVAAEQRPLAVSFDGIWFQGGVDVAGWAQVELSHSTLRPAEADADGDGRPVLIATPAGGKAPTIVLSHCLAGPVRLHEGASLRLVRSVVDGGGQAAITGDGAVRCVAATVIGATRSTTFDAVDTVVTGSVACPRVGDVTVHHSAVGAIGTPVALMSERYGDAGYARPVTPHGVKAHDGGDGGDGIGALAWPGTAARERLVEASVAQVLPVGTTANITWLATAGR